MSGTKEGGSKVRDTHLSKDPDYYRKIGAIGGKARVAKGFGSKKVGSDGLTGKQRARVAGKRGGEVTWYGKRNRWND